MENNKAMPFHGYYDIRTRPYQTYNAGQWTGTIVRHTTTNERTLSYQFTPHFHPYAEELIRRLLVGDLQGLQDADTDYKTNPDGSQVLLPDGTPRPTLYEELFTSSSYNPSGMVQTPYPVKDLDFSSSGAYSVYNWELFYHIPLIVAIHLSQDHRFEDAQRWFHYVFDPTDDSAGPTPARFWKVKPFQTTDVELIEHILLNLSTGADAQLQQDTILSIEAWKDNPFDPFLVARYRPTAFMLKTVMAYLDNLIAWGDSLFQEDSVESINEATQIYVLAANLLGVRPQEVPQKGSVQTRTYANIRANLDAFGNALVNLETDIPFDITPHPAGATQTDQLGATLGTLGNTLYFCVPRNDTLLGYWDTVADRLFKIHNSLNFQGIFRQLPLFQPPIDPALLVRAAAEGLDIGAVVSGLNQPLPLVRFQLLLQKATEICQEVKSLGAGLLAAMEKGDNEALAILRAQHETTILQLGETVKYQQWQEAIKSREGLEQSFANAVQRYTYYELQLGRQVGDIASAIPSLDPLDTNGLENMSYSQDEPVIPQRTITVDIAQDLNASGGKHISSSEVEELSKLSSAHDLQIRAAAMDIVGSALAVVPEINIHGTPLGVGVASAFGGVQLSKILSLLASSTRVVADQYSYEAGQASRIGGFARREMDWAYQSNLAADEMTQILKQLRAAQIRESITEREWHNHQTQIKQAQEIERFLTDEKNGKETNQAFYLWMKREVKGLYNQCFQFAFEVARKAERALQRELGDTSLTYLQTTYLSGKEGLLAGEKLFQDLKSMEMSYHDLNAREYELTKNVSLLQLDPVALLQLRTTGQCTFTLPEELFDLDGPGHYFRRIKTVALSIPCVVGPYTSVNCTLTLLKSSIRLTSDGDYARRGADDPRFSDYFGSLQSVVTSTAQNDSGLFETNLHDERYLPFESSGVISQWQLQLPADVRQFDFETIADVILHVRYTAREAGALLRKNAVANLQKSIDNAQTIGSVRLFSVRHDFPTDWAKFKNAPLSGVNAVAALSLTLLPEHYPFWSQGILNKLTQVVFFVPTTSITITDKADGAGNKDTLTLDGTLNLQRGNLTHIPLPTPLGKFTLYLNDNTMADLWIAVTWGK